MEYFTFGNILKVYNNLKGDSIKTDIANVYDLRSVSSFENYIRTVVAIRNICAHGSVMFDLKLNQSITSNGPVSNINNSNKIKLYSAIRVINYILSKVSENRANEMDEQIANIFNKHKKSTEIKDIITNSIGYEF